MMYGFHGRYLKHTNSLILPPLSQIHTLIINMFYMTFITCNTMICYTPSSKLRDIDVTMSKRRPDSRTLRTSIFKTSYQYLCVEKVNIFLMKVYNKTVIDWIPGQQQFCLTLERILPSACGFGQRIRPRVKQNYCCPRTQSISYIVLMNKYLVN